MIEYTISRSFKQEFYENFIDRRSKNRNVLIKTKVLSTGINNPKNNN